MKHRILTFAGIAALAVVATLAVPTAANAKNARSTKAGPVPQAAAKFDLPFPAAEETVFHPINPVRILDTRSTLGGHLGPITSAAPFNLQVTGSLGGLGTVVPSGAAAA